MTWGQRFKVERDRLGLTQTELAAKLGTDARSVKRWEADANRPDVSLELIAELSPGFGQLVAERLAEVEAALERVEEIDAEMQALRDERTLLRRKARRVTGGSAPQEHRG